MASQSRAETVLHLLGRAIFGGYFLYSGLHHFLDREPLVEQARRKGVAAPDLAVAGSGLLIVAGGLSLLAGTRPKVGAGLIAAFLLGVSPQMHAFWKEQDAEKWMNEFVNSTKNMALIGEQRAGSGASRAVAVERAALMPRSVALTTTVR